MVKTPVELVHGVGRGVVAVDAESAQGTMVEGLLSMVPGVGNVRCDGNRGTNSTVSLRFLPVEPLEGHA